MNLFRIFELEFWIGLLYCLPAIVIGLSFHEFAHAYVAYKCGDPTARNLGRMTLNPLAHFDPIGLICIILLGFGWAKPVPVNPNNYRGNIRTCDIAVSLAGIAMNVLIATVAMFLMYGIAAIKFNEVFSRLLYYIAYINITLAIFNLIPVYPLDGFHVFEDLFSRRLGINFFMNMRRYGMFILIAVILTLNTSGILSTVVDFIINGLNGLCSLIFNFNFNLFG